MMVQMTKCAKCGAQAPTANQFCGVCGQSLTAPAGQSKSPAKYGAAPAMQSKPPAKTVPIPVAQGKPAAKAAPTPAGQGKPAVKATPAPFVQAKPQLRGESMPTAVRSATSAPVAEKVQDLPSPPAGYQYVPPAEKKGCGVLAWLTTGIGCIIVVLAIVAVLALVVAVFVLKDENLALLFNSSPAVVAPQQSGVTSVPPVTSGTPLPVAPQSPPVTAGIGYADYVGSWFSVNGDLGENNTLIMRMENGQLVCISANGANRLILALQADGSVYNVALGEGMNVPVRCQLTADKKQLILTELFEASEPSTTVFQRVK